MPLSGLPNPIPGLAMWSSVASVPALATGLILLRITRPSEARRLSQGKASELHEMMSPVRSGKSEASAALRLYSYRLGGVFGALLVFISLVLSSMVSLVGAADDAEQRAALVIPLISLPVLWSAERFLLQGAPLPPLQSLAAALVLVASMSLTWAAPQPQDSLTMGLDGELMGCDGGTRLIFALYMAIWITAAIFGTLLLIPSDQEDPRALEVISCESDEGRPEPAKPSLLRKKFLPVLYGLCINVANILLAYGVASNHIGCVLLGAGLLVVSVLCAWDWMWRMELTLGSWAPAAQLFTAFLQWLQAQCIFRNYRYATVFESGLFVVHQEPGIWIMAAGFVLSFFMVTMFLNADDSAEWGAGGIRYEQLSHSATRALIPAKEGNRFARCIACFLFPFCVATLLLGISRPAFVTTMHGPSVIMQADTFLSTATTSTTTVELHATEGKTYLDLIPISYNNRMPVSALAMIWGSFVAPTMQFIQIMILLFRPLFVPRHFKKWARAAVVDGASGRFVTPMVIMLLVSFANMSAPEGELMKVSFGQGFVWFILYGFISVALALALEVDADLMDSTEQKGLEESKSPRSSDSSDSGDSEEENMCDGEGKKLRLGTSLAFVLLAVAGSAMYVGFTYPFLNFEFRIDGLIVSTMNPTVLDFWRSLEEASDWAGKWAASTLFLGMLAWVPFVLIALRCSDSSWARTSEKAARQWVMGHHWAVAILLLYYIFTQRNRGIVEVCVSFPRPPIGPWAVAVMGGAVIGLQSLSTWLVTPKAIAQRPGKADPGAGLEKAIPKLGIPVPLWGAAVGACFVFTFVWLYNHGMELAPRLETLDDVNDRLAAVVQVINNGLGQQLPESAGDCDALWDYRVQHNQTGSTNPGSMDHQKCVGNKPVAHKGTDSVDLTVRWLTGLNSLRLTQLVVLPPSDDDDEGRWNFAIDGYFSDLHAWIKVDLNNAITGKQVWLDDNMCCTNPFHFRLQLTAVCTNDDGFHNMHVEMPQMDPIEIEHSVHEGSLNYQMDYGSYDLVEQTLKKLFRKKTDAVEIKEGDGTVIDPMVKLSEVVEQVVQLNTGHTCPKNFNGGKRMSQVPAFDAAPASTGVPASTRAQKSPDAKASSAALFGSFMG